MAEHCRRSYSDIFDLIGGFFNGDEVTETDFWVSMGLESEADHPERYRWDGNHYCIIEESERVSKP